MGQRSTNEAVSLTMLGGSGCSSKGVREMRAFPRLVAAMTTLELLGKLTSSAASAPSTLPRSVSTNDLASRGCPMAA